MGRSAKLMKRPSKAERVARQVNAPAKPRQRSMSPDVGPSPIPLFNTSVPGRPGAAPRRDGKGRLAQISKVADDLMSVDSSKAPSPAGTPMEDDLPPALPTAASKGKKTAAQRLAAAKESVALDQAKNRSKLAGKGGARSKGGDKFSLGVDYVKLHESRPGGAFASKKLR